MLALGMPEPIDDTYPVVLRLRGRRVLVVGGGRIARRKTEALVRAGADVTVVAPEVVDGFDDVHVVRREYTAGDVDGMWLVIAATDDPEVQQQVFDDCERAGVFVNAVDDPDRCSFILPAIERRGPVIVAALPADVDALAERIAAERAAAHARGESTEDLDWSSLLEHP
jgi:precorrin-2 dehydrogenase / sirohydrochlorin ferrochelatase